MPIRRDGSSWPSRCSSVVRVADEEYFPGCPVAPTALESPIISPRLHVVAARCFDQWESLLAARLRADGWPEHSVPETASAVSALVQGALLLARVTRQLRHLANAMRAALALLSAPNWEDR